MLFPSIRVIEYPRFNVESGDSASNRDSRLSSDAFFLFYVHGVVPYNGLGKV